MAEPIVLPPHPWSSDIKEYYDIDGASVGTVGYVYDANGIELAVLYRTTDHPAVLPLLTAAPDLLTACEEALLWFGPDGDHISDPARALLVNAVAKAGAL